MKIFENEWADCVAKAILATGGIFIFIMRCVILFKTPTDASRTSINVTQIERHEFKDDRVICYVLKTPKTSGIYCLPLKDKANVK